MDCGVVERPSCVAGDNLDGTSQSLKKKLAKRSADTRLFGSLLARFGNVGWWGPLNTSVSQLSLYENLRGLKPMLGPHRNLNNKQQAKATDQNGKKIMAQPRACCSKTPKPNDAIEREDSRRIICKFYRESNETSIHTLGQFSVPLQNEKKHLERGNSLKFRLDVELIDILQLISACYTSKERNIYIATLVGEWRLLNDSTVYGTIISNIISPPPPDSRTYKPKKNHNC